ncbi:MAG: hypothetical protein JSS75_03215 [Bacteroidetes bacterium]|nr:hypothetical protein [Bacteroidota bacterium]
MKNPLVVLCAALLVLIGITDLQAKVGDTTHVVVVDKHLWDQFPGTIHNWGVFPAAGGHYEKVLLRYRLTCPKPSCGQWDYTTKVILRQHTGIIDSVLKDAPNFTVNGGMQDSFQFSHSPTITTSYNSTKKKTDTAASASVQIMLYQNFVNPWKPIDSVTVWPAGYWNFLYDNTGAKVDSFYVRPDSVYHLKTVKAYWPYERTFDYEVARYITPYGQGFPTNWTYVWTMDVTDYAFLMHDSVEFLSTYDGYTQGSLYSLSFDMIEGSPARETYRVDRLYDGYYPYGNVNDPISNYVKPVNVYMDPNADFVTFRTFTTGHGNAGPSAAAEFLERTHEIWLDGTKRYEQHLWRTDCMFNPAYPQTGTWTLSRAGWCPGDKVDPWDYDLTAYGKKGDSINVDYRFEDYNVSGGGYAVQAQAIYSKGPKYNTDVAIMAIEAPTNEPQFKRTNPICSQMAPIIDIRNNGKSDLTSLTIRYGINGATDHTFQWTGLLKYYQTGVITLPGINLGTDTNTFNVVLDQPNGTADEYTNNNTGSSVYFMPKIYSSVIALALKVDDMSSAGIDNGIRYEVRDASDKILYSQGGFADGESVKDTFRLATGCYRFIIYDESEIPQGLYPWFIQGAKFGSYSLRDDKKVVIWNATTSNNLASFGGREIIPFQVLGQSSVPVSQFQSPLDFRIVSNPAHERIALDLSPSGSYEGSMTITVSSILGKDLVTRTVTQDDGPRIEIDMQHYTAGSYIVRIEYGQRRLSKMVVLQ